MPRSLRIEYDGAWYHVMNRGVNHQNIYHSADHFMLFLELLENTSKLFGCEIHAYCLMNNHYHLIIHTPLGNLSKAMQYLDGVYAQRFNLIQNRDGPLFRGRYKAILIEKEIYLLQVSRYIHLNPVSAKICMRADEYLWSSYRYYLNATSKSWINTKYILNFFGQYNANLMYKKYINEGVDDETNIFYSKQIPSPIFGREEFIQDIIKSLNHMYKKKVSTDIKKTIKLVDPLIILETIEKYFVINRDTLERSTRGRKNYPRMLAMYFLRHLAHCSHKEIAEYLKGIQPHAVSALLARADSWVEKDTVFKQHLLKLQKHFNY